MEWMLAYVFVLALLPMILMAVTASVRPFNVRGEKRRSVPARSFSRSEILGARIALEAQFLVAPARAVEEAELLLTMLGSRKLKVAERPSHLSQRAYFETLLVEIERFERLAAPSHARTKNPA